MVYFPEVNFYSAISNDCLMAICSIVIANIMVSTQPSYVVNFYCIRSNDCFVAICSAVIAIIMAPLSPVTKAMH